MNPRALRLALPANHVVLAGLLALEDGSLVRRDLWFDKEKGLIVDAQKTFYELGQRPSTTIDLSDDIVSPGFLDIQINGAYGFDFSIFPQDDANAGKEYDSGLRMVASRIVETGVTSATLLGWHAEGPFLHHAKRGAHMPGYLLDAPDGFETFETIYGASALKHQTELGNKGVNGVAHARRSPPFVRMITVAPEIAGVIPAIEELFKRGVVCSIGHSIASSDTSLKAVQSGARLITHLFNAMPQLHHRDPSIIGLLGASPILANQKTNPDNNNNKPKSQFTYGDNTKKAQETNSEFASEAFSDVTTPPQTPIIHPVTRGAVPPFNRTLSNASIKGKFTPSVAAPPPIKLFKKPYYGIIVDGCHSHAHSVRVSTSLLLISIFAVEALGDLVGIYRTSSRMYSYYRRFNPTFSAMPMLDPHLEDGLHDWRDNRRLIKEGVKLYIEGTDTLAGSVVTLDICVRNFVQFTGCTLGEALKCVTYNPAACLGIENRKGTLRAGADADLVILDSDGYIKGTWVGGEEVWSTAK
ncbi:hypothetical protein Clacol_005076 [Clathrus columnatus]|uniref:Amidohydrolase-related domain-containing protein n=1 Tax=Clathrus columnatus TaxID=1419009 RepID=A0AAV5ABJ2_9AGAM|nr:hypothetical protein Clacol_005076 [Clathrus columnatus]